MDWEALGGNARSAPAREDGETGEAGKGRRWRWFQQRSLASSSPGITPTGIATFGPGNLFTTNGGTSWSTSTILNSFVIEGTPVPGPAVLAMLGGAGLVGTRRRRRD